MTARIENNWLTTKLLIFCDIALMS
jgi:hypothetical protein